MIPIDGFFSPTTTEVIARTFLHFLWQGVAIGALLSLGLSALARRSAAERYAFCVAGMAALVAAPAVTLAVIRTSIPDGNAITAASSIDMRAIQPFFPWLTTLWVLGASLLQLRLCLAWLQAHVAIRRARPIASPEWTRLAASIGDRLGVTRAVRILESRAVCTPAVVGWLRPVILVPAGFLESLPLAHVRAILAHELAHVRRYDFLVNIAQGVFESLLFFHPVTWWLSKRLRVEREFCCDDAAVAVCASRLEYARALSAVETLRHDAPSFAVSAKGGDLVSRIHRMVGRRPDDRKPSRMGTPLMAVLLAGALVWVAAVACDSTEPSTASPVAASDSDGQLGEDLHDVTLHGDATSAEASAEHNVFFHDDDSATMSFDVDVLSDHTVVRVVREGADAEPVVLEFMKDATPDQAHEVVLEKIRSGELSPEEGKAALYKLLETTKRSMEASVPFGEAVVETQSD